MHGVLLAIPNYTFIPSGTALDTIAHKTFITFAIAGFPNPPYTITLIGLVIIAVLAIAANGITEKLTGKKVGSVTTAIIVTIIGSALASAYVLLPFDFAIEGVRIIAALLGAIVIAVFVTLIKAQTSSSSSKH
jgi:drug/metabolite transporter (DMT)-like permease